ncbi:MAG: TetM/TetW/TetO/TetS family tetracycline resistance ribosomal protection protein [Hespellia sp.]|nr:TetM/TetW/TetO/TetS family tetracycline resistance ribosomal protection protein [Hespellia sp.]
MDDISRNRPKKHICAALLAHVDSGKTTLSEAMLYASGAIRKLGRVDSRDAYLDTFDLERERGITIFSKQARLEWGNLEITLLDTPGHVDFSAEMERTLQVLDYAILVISGADGVQGHTQTLWKLLSRYQIPTFLFVNKMDQAGTDRQRLMQELQKRLSEYCVDFGETQAVLAENLALCEEQVMESYLENGCVNDSQIQQLVAQRKVFPCYFGSALKLDGVEELLRGLEAYGVAREYPEHFGARVFKIGRDDSGSRLTYMKITGGSLKVKDVLSRGTLWNEKVNQIRVYSGEKFEVVSQVHAGRVCAVTGLTQTHPGEGLGAEEDAALPILEPVLTYSLILPEDCDARQLLPKLRMLEEEEPELHIVWNESLQEIQVQIMGDVQIEILQYLIKKRFDVWIEFGTGNIVYKETITEPVEGVGHFEPLRHYAEVHLLLEPGERGSGLVFHASCSEDKLDKNWQRLIRTHLEEREHAGVLTGSVVTDMNVTLTAGKAHLKHTEGGDFRQATYRALRQGLKKAQQKNAGLLLEPYYEFRLEVPTEYVGRAMSDLERMGAAFTAPELEGEHSILSGRGPVSSMRTYPSEIAAYTKGQGRISYLLGGYEPCHNMEEVLEQSTYDSERDLENPTGSVFCAHGAGFVVPWDEVEDYMHLEGLDQRETSQEMDLEKIPERSVLPRSRGSNIQLTQKELDELYSPTILRNRQKSYKPKETVRFKEGTRVEERPSVAAEYRKKKAEPLPEYLLVDGYNIIFSWEELKSLAEVNLDGARLKLQDMLCNYQGYKKCRLIVVFDAYKVPGHQVTVMDYHNIQVVFTKEAETADQYIEKAAHEMGHKYKVTVATSDGLEQIIIRSKGCFLLSSKDLEEDMRQVSTEIRQDYLEKRQPGARNYPFENLAEKIEQ